MINEKVRQMILEKYNTPLQYPQQCEALSMAIYEATGETLSTTTLKRLFGFVKGPKSLRSSSLDIIANYLGYADYDLLLKEIGKNTDISDFSNVESNESVNIKVGTVVRISYQPNRVLILRYLGDNKYVVTEARGSKLQKDDVLMISGFYIGFELLISDVVRNGLHLGSYRAAKQGGLTGIEIIN